VNHQTLNDTGGGYSEVSVTDTAKEKAMAQTTPKTLDRSETSTGTNPSYIHNKTKDDYLKRLRRIEGQARGLQRMVEEEQYCIDILTQVSAMTKALQSVALALLDEHMGHCVVDAARAGGPEAEIKLKEASDAIARLVRS
jgi:CsoR family transcriptional regulator, copper-sensing transcriptional repressor